MEQLRGIDAFFLYLESSNAPMHIGGVVLVQPEGQFDFDRYRDLIESRLHLSSLFRRRLVEVPFGLGRPYWVEDPSFDLDAHVHYTALPRPRGWRELRRVAQHEFRLPLDPRRPLWSMTFVESLDGIEDLPPGTFAVVYKVHHAVADGLGTLDLWNALWDPTPQVRDLPETEPWQPEMMPNPLAMLLRAYVQTLRSPQQLLRVAAGVLKGGVNIGRELVSPHRLKVPSLLAAPHTCFNEPITARRAFDAVSLPLADIKFIKNAVRGTTVNDVVLAICSGALAHYLDDRDELPDEPLHAMVPVSVRGEDGGAGNQVSAMVVALATDEPDPVRRLQRIHDSAAGSKEYHRAVGAQALMDTAQIVPYTLGSAAARLYTRMHIAHYHRPAFNLVITNVPGPSQPLYFGGGRLLASFGTAPVVDGLGMIIVVTSYIAQLAISVTACRDVCPDVEVFVSYLGDAFAELRDAVSARRPRPVSPRRRPSAGSRASSGQP